MATLHVKAPDGKTLNVNVPEGTDPSQYDAMAEEAVSHYSSSNGQQNSILNNPVLNKIASTGLAAGEAVYAPYQMIGEAIRGAGEGEPLKIATAQDPSGFRMPSIVQRLADKYKTPEPAADPFQKAYQGLEGIANLPLGVQAASQAVTQKPDVASQLGGLAMALGLGKAGDPYEGMSIAKKTLFEPKVPANRAFDIATAEKYGAGDVLTRADKTGSKAASNIESAVGNTLTGSGPIQANNAEKMRILEEARQKIGNQFGTSMPPSAIGHEGRMKMRGEIGAYHEFGKDLYKQIPDVPIPPSGLLKAIDETDMANTPNPAAGVINEIRGRLGHQAPITEAGTASSVGPVSAEVPSVPTFQKLNDIRNLLSKEIQADTKYNHVLGNQEGPKAKALIPLKKALEQDFQAYVKASQGTPYGKMESGTFENAFNRANSYWGKLKELKSNPLVQKLADKDVAQSDIPDIIFKSGNIEDITTAKLVLGKDAYGAVKRKFFTDLFESKNIGRELSKYSDEFLRGAFEPNELQALKEADSLAKTIKTAESVAGNSSRTAQHIGTMATGAGLFDAAKRSVSNPWMAILEAAATLGVPFGVAKAYLATSKGITVPSGIQGGFGKLAASVGAAAGQGINGLAQNEKNKEILSNVLKKIRSQVPSKSDRVSSR